QIVRRSSSGIGAGYFRSRARERPVALLSSLASIVPSLSGLAALKRFSTSARNSFLSRVPSLSGSAAAKSLALTRPRNSRLSRVPSAPAARQPAPAPTPAPAVTAPSPFQFVAPTPTTGLGIDRGAGDGADAPRRGFLAHLFG